MTGLIDLMCIGYYYSVRPSPFLRHGDFRWLSDSEECDLHPAQKMLRIISL
ncbi:hypothetical protein SAMN02745166_03465 [Prosthecobacter debontii]|uniref:Uncharacterized protein n=1 Tax=Prosthecobacter debontii TaxID=48467 RepID=A0A1T4YJ00_9BACT|nr:hypothetical protein SAMN02745166_03465 [Prosthecobacter debontii]